MEHYEAITKQWVSSDTDSRKRDHDEGSLLYGSLKLPKTTKSGSLGDRNVGASSNFIRSDKYGTGSQHELEIILARGMVEANARTMTNSEQKFQLELALKTVEYEREKERAESDKKYKRLSKRVGMLEGEISQARIRAGDLDGSLLVKEQQVMVLEAKLRDKEDLEAKIRSKEEMISAFHETLRSKEEAMAASEAGKRDLENLVATLEAKLRCNEEATVALKAELRSKDDAMAALDAKLRCNEEATVALKAELRSKDDAMVALDAGKRALEEKLVAKDGLISTLEANLQFKDGSISSLETNLQSKEAIAASLEAELARYRNHRGAARSDAEASLPRTTRTPEQNQEFEKDLDDFIEKNIIEVSDIVFTPAAEMLRAFSAIQSANGKDVPSNIVFFKRLKHQLYAKNTDIAYTRYQSNWGYRGLGLVRGR